MVMDVNCEIGLDELVRDKSFRVIHYISKQRQMPSVEVGAGLALALGCRSHACISLWLQER